MRTAEQAREAAVARLAADDFAQADVALIDSETQEFDAGWVYYYQSKRYLRTRVWRDQFVGCAPLFVPRNGAEPAFISYHRPIADSLEAFVRCGDANAVPIAQVELRGWNVGAAKVAATQAIREFSSLGLAAAHDVVNQCLEGKPVTVSTVSVAAAHELASRLVHLKFVAAVAYGR